MRLKKLKIYKIIFDNKATINENGLCYTYNNLDLGLDPRVTETIAQVRNVKGCGKSKGLRVIVDSHGMTAKSIFKKREKVKYVLP